MYTTYRYALRGRRGGGDGGGGGGGELFPAAKIMNAAVADGLPGAGQTRQVVELEVPGPAAWWRGGLLPLLPLWLRRFNDFMQRKE